MERGRFKLETSRKETSRVVIKQGVFKEIPTLLRTQFLSEPLDRDYFIIHDRNIPSDIPLQLASSFSAAGLKSPDSIPVPDGEEAKDMDWYLRVVDVLEQLGAKRSSVLIALGGGSVGDLTGFVAATFKRGVSYIQVPTTLLAQVDSSVGGKTAINTRNGKNMVGAFHNPIAVFTDPELLQTLPDREIRSALAEVIKYTAMDDLLLAKVDQHLEELLGLEMDITTEVIEDCVGIKLGVANIDPYDTGVRNVLNFGHTIGHGIEEESHSSVGHLTHGEAVAIGMVLESNIAVRHGYMTSEERNRLAKLLTRAHLPIHIPRHIDTFKAVAFMRNDKKNETSIRIVVPRKGVEKLAYISVTEQELQEALRSEL